MATRGTALGALATTGALLLAAAPTGAGVPPGCPNAELSPDASNLERIELATLCLVNSERAAHGLTSLYRNVRLDTASRRHSRDMVARGYFDHLSPSPGRTAPGDRMKLAGYPDGAELTGGGENIAAGTGALSTPASIVASWMESLGHRRNILSLDHRETGMGVAVGFPGESRSEGATYTNLFASRDPSPNSGATGLERARRSHAGRCRTRAGRTTRRSSRCRSARRRQASEHG